MTHSWQQQRLRSGGLSYGYAMIRDGSGDGRDGSGKRPDLPRRYSRLGEARGERWRAIFDQIFPYGCTHMWTLAQGSLRDSPPRVRPHVGAGMGLFKRHSPKAAPMPEKETDGLARWQN